MGAPRIVADDGSWPMLGQAWSERVSVALAPVAGDVVCEHIGSTAVPGLGAKPILDLQVRVPELLDDELMDAALAAAGFTRALGARPDSPGVAFDTPRPGAPTHPALYAKQLFHRVAQGADPEIILHVRRADSPFAAFVATFRDWLAADPANAARYCAVKRELADVHGGDADYDDYTRAKGAFFDEIQPELDAFAAAGPALVVRVLEEADVAGIEASEPAGQGFVRAMWALQSAGTSTLLVAWEGAASVGSAEVRWGDEVELANLSVRSSARGRGVGSALVAAAEALIGSGSLSMGVGLDNPRARALYERLGYRGTGEITTTTYEYVDDDGIRHTATETDERLVKEL